MRGDIENEILYVNGNKRKVKDVHSRNKCAEILSKCYGMQKEVIKLEQTVFFIGGDPEERERKIINDVPIDYLLEMDGDSND